MEDIEDNCLITSEHDRLIKSISKLDKTQFITEPTRNEATNVHSEFNLVKSSKKLNLEKVVNVLSDTTHHSNIRKQLKKTQHPSKVLRKPLEKPQAERIKRLAGYEITKKKLSRWDPVVARLRTVDCVSFPLQPTLNKIHPSKEFLSKLSSKSSLEKELEEIIPQPKDIDVEDEEKVYPMSYEEMLEHRKNLAQLRAQQSYQAAKAKRQGKIKSKKYHRILKKEKLKQQLKEFEDLRKTDPEEALKKLESLEKVRALERHTLRHKNTGKWAKSKLVRAKYDKEVRQQIAEQLAVSRNLTHKTTNTDSTDESDGEVIPNLSFSHDPMNPWVTSDNNKTNVDKDFDFGYKKYFLNLPPNQNDPKNNISNSLKDLKEDIIADSNKKLLSNKRKDEIPKSCIKMKKLKKDIHENVTVISTMKWNVDDNTKISKIKEIEDISQAFTSFEKNIAVKVEKKLNKLRNDIKSLENFTEKNGQKNGEEKEESSSLKYLEFKNKNQKAIIDESLIESVPGRDHILDLSDSHKSNIHLSKEVSIKPNIDPSKFIEIKPKYLNSCVPGEENGIDDLDDNDEQIVPKVNIEEVFEEDDVVASFRLDKEDEANKNKIQETDLSLPGWGSWGGKGVKAPRKRKNRFILKAPPITPRRDDNKGDIIIKEFKEPKLSAHKVTEIPFPFESVKDYEASIRAPIGNTFIPISAHRKLTEPSVKTRSGTIIEPMDENELLSPKHQTFNNPHVIRLVSKK